MIFAAIAAFAVGMGGVMLVLAWRRTEAHRDALIDALKRIERLEAALQGRVPPAPIMGPAAPAPALESPPEPQPLPAPAHAAHAAAPIIAEPPPVSPADVIGAPFWRRLDFAAALAGLVTLCALGAVRMALAPITVGLGLALAAALACIGLALWRARAGEDNPAALALMSGFGFVLAGLTLIVARTTPDALGPLEALIAANALALGALLAAWRHGPLLLWMGIAAALAAPTLAPLQGVEAMAALIGLGLASAATGLRARALGAWMPASAMLCGMLAWTAALSALGAPGFVGAAGAAAVSAALLGLALAWEAPAQPSDGLRMDLGLVGYGALAGALTCLLLLIARTGADATAAGAHLVALILVATIIAALRPSLRAAALIACFAGVLAALVWPPAADRSGAPVLAAAIAAIAALGGAMMRLNAPAEIGSARIWAVLVALTPPAALVGAQAAAADLAPAWIWSLIGLAVCAALGAVGAALRRSEPAAASLFITGAALSLVCALAMAPPQPWPTLVAALCLPLLAWIDGRVNEPGLRFAMTGLGAMLVLLVGGLYFHEAPQSARIALALVAALSALSAAQSLAHGDPRWLSAQSLFTFALGIAGLAATLEATRYGADPQNRLAALGASAVAWLTIALAMARNFGPRPRLVFRIAETVALIGGFAIALIGAGIVANPWWGALPAPAPTAPTLNSIALALLAPALLLGLYDWLRARQGLMLRANLALAGGLLLLSLYATLEVRRAVQGAAMAGPELTSAEGWAYAALMIGFAASLALLSLERRAAWLMHTAAAICLLALVKIGVFDAQTLPQPAYAATLGVLLAAGLSLAALYRRVVLPFPADTPKTVADTEATPQA